MHAPSMMKAVAVGAMVLGAQAFATNLEKSGPAATCKCKNAADCTCPKGQCKCKNCGNKNRVKVFETLTGAHETTHLPDTARVEDARGGVFI